MKDSFRLDVEPPAHGWTTVRLTASGVVLAFAASYTPRDSISDLARAAAGLAAGEPEQVVTWNSEPREYEFRFLPAEGRTRLEVHEFPDARRRWRRAETPIAVVEGDTLAVTRVIWREMRRLQGAASSEEFAFAWGHPFPAAVVERVGELLRGQTGHETASPA
jgi:hypothetical protein